MDIDGYRMMDAKVVSLYPNLKAGNVGSLIKVIGGGPCPARSISLGLMYSTKETLKTCQINWTSK